MLNSLVGIAIAAVFALRSGRAEDAFLRAHLQRRLRRRAGRGRRWLRWPLVGFMIGGVTGDPTGWHKDKHLVALCTKLTWCWPRPACVRVVVQYPLWAAHQAGWLGVAKLAMGWPLQLAALAAMAWLLSRDQTPIPIKTAHRRASNRRPASG